MNKCIFCETDMDNNSEELCCKCRNKFEKCEICETYVLAEELSKNGICDECNYGNWCNN